jgi:phosphoglycolate phosphatase
MIQRLVLWDIDGTLMYTGGITGKCMRNALSQIYGEVAEEARHQYAGKTDRQIIFEAFADRAQADLVEAIDRFTEVYMAELEASRAAVLEHAELFEGVREVLAELAARPVVQSALTGNILPAARWKLDTMGLLPFFDLEAGAYGSDHHERVQLPAIAAARAAQRYGRPFAGPEVVVIGDTPSDIACGRAFGARTVAVASGPFSVDQLRAHQPDAVLPSLADTRAALDAILG